MTNTFICVDSSFIVRLTTVEPSVTMYSQLWQKWMTEENLVIAPTLLCYEVTSVFHRLKKAGQILETEAQTLLTEVLDLPIQFHGDIYLHYQAIEISQTLNLPATYDAHYLVLAQRFQANLYTSDKRLFNSVKSSLSWVHLVEV
ncbi:MAG: type II toxin-antitoxin system VapC family toxin [Microcystis aeruginosa G11-01]|uniref:Type II toxin-antitoxin system VapC family toxin n=1 Tax=Microcystis aeruginosa G11-04 TaxID=2685956 RepID=A0A966G350_MICAE|nr:type II toxin-antitoxin system VapC family toxin [Microcystis aeruginosa G13-10]NCS33659.1 type II toxin-antitoxin system VapC family toxin [Microcystis aeruginosa G11-01]NCS58908.1 type II toxin-antitoxin system VapC family toxin [Microcystis aeruginosa G11-04]NCT45556.1 type II toxin-antitoxin system VapC family toxin [Microcystis aeruginosa G11-09]